MQHQVISCERLEGKEAWEHGQDSLAARDARLWGGSQNIWTCPYTFSFLGLNSNWIGSELTLADGLLQRCPMYPHGKYFFFPLFPCTIKQRYFPFKLWGCLNSTRLCFSTRSCSSPRSTTSGFTLSWLSYINTTRVVGCWKMRGKNHIFSHTAHSRI